MTEEFESYKGIHPGAVIERILAKGGLDQRKFARSPPLHPRSFTAILKSKHRLNTILSLKIERALDLEEGALMTLQVFYEIKLARLKLQGPGPDLRKGHFWDVHFEMIDWARKWHFVIQRVYERGDQEERDEIDRYYGLEKVNIVIAGKPMLPSGNLSFMPPLNLEYMQLTNKLRELRKKGVETDESKAEEQKMIIDIKAFIAKKQK